MSVRDRVALLVGAAPAPPRLAPLVRPRARRGVLLSALALASLALVYWWMASAGGARTTVDLPYYDALARAFLAGRLDLGPAPPELLALTDPYHPALNAPYRGPVHDLSLYQGRLYMYWGPLPALLRLPSLAVTGAPPPPLALHVGAALLAALGFIFALRRAASLLPARGSVVLVAVLGGGFALGGLMPYLVGRPSVYHEPLLVAIACAVWAWYALLRAWAGGNRAGWWLAAAGALLAGAVAARVVYVAAAAAAVLVVGVWAVRAPRAERGRRLAGGAALVAPLLVVGVLLAAYNWVRFDDPREFGLNLVLQDSAELYQASRGYGGSAARWTIPHVLGLYLGAIPALSPLFPHLAWTHGPLSPPGTALLWPDLGGASGGYVPALGLYLELPLASLWLLAPASLGLLLIPFLWRGRRAPPAMRALALVLVLSAAGGLGVLLLIRSVSVRYLADFLPACALAGAMGLLWLFARLGGIATWRGRLLAGTATAFSGGAVVLGTVLAVGMWQSTAPDRALAVRYVVDEAIARLADRVAPTSESWLAPAGRTRWRAGDGRVWAGSSLYLQAPSAAPWLVVDGTLDHLDPTIIAVQTDGEYVHSESIEPGPRLLMVGPLRGVTAGASVRVQFFSLDPPLPAGSPFPFKVAGVGLLPDAAAVAAYCAAWAGGPPLNVRGASGDGWVTDAGLELVLGPMAARRAAAITLAGPDNPWRTAPLTVAAEAWRGDESPRAIPAVVRQADERYTITLDLSEPPGPPEATLRLRLVLGPSFVPRDLDGSADTRALVVRAPDAVAIVPRAAP